MVSGGILQASHLDVAFWLECGERAYTWWWIGCDRDMARWYR